MEFMHRFVDGSLRFGAPALTFGLVDVRDVADAHVKAGFTPHASGRHLLLSDTLSMLQIGQILCAHFGSGYPFPRSEAPKALLWLSAPLLNQNGKSLRHECTKRPD